MKEAAGASKPDAAAVEVLSEVLKGGTARVADCLASDPLGGRTAAAAQTEVMDRVVRAALDFVTTARLPNANPARADAIAVVAIGGYGRGEMAPYSDVDLLFLTTNRKSKWVDEVIEATLYLFWDLKLKVGQSVRSIAECVKLAKDDITIRTSLLEKRFLWGDEGQVNQLRAKLRRDLFADTGREFAEAKLAERDARHSRNGGSRYLVEPNVKEAKGGLRDLQTLFWIAKYIYDVETSEDLMQAGVFRPDEYDTFLRAERFLWTVRCHLHMIAGRAQERLTFDHQVEIAERMGFTERDGKRGVEHFMQAYYRHAKEVGELTRFFCAALEADQKKDRPGVGALLRALNFGATREVHHGLFIRDGRIDVGEESFLEEDPLNIFRLFEEGLRTGALVHPNALRMVARRLDLIDEEFRQSPEANRLFMRLLVESENPERALRRLNETGALGEFIPDFDRIVALMQFSMYHHYTVDEHTIVAIGGLKRVEQGELIEDLPITSRILEQGVDRAVLYIALFLHDIGKGRPEPHEEIGAEIAKQLCPRLGMTEAQTETVEWLVRHHLVMSDFAQKRDISDPRTVRAFADQVRSAQRLKLLMVLTALDIRAVGPGVLNNWKSQLLRDLYSDTLEVLTQGNESAGVSVRTVAAQEALRARLKSWSEEEIGAWFATLYRPFWLGLDTETQARVASMVKRADAEKVYSRFDQDKQRGATRCCLYMADHPGIFSRMAGALALSGVNVLDARTYTSSDGMAVSVFWITERDGPIPEAKHDKLKKSIHKALSGDVVAREALKPKRNLKRRERPFDVPTTITFDNESSELYTVIEVDTRDRVGLLYDLTRTLAGANVNINSAVITTYGEQAVDAFYVKDLFGFKITQASKQKAIEQRLRDAITRAREQSLEQV
ncbi:MAG: [protein-PII] uridylyltransferase [Pseudomonadota bacterium]